MPFASFASVLPEETEAVVEVVVAVDVVVVAYTTPMFVLVKFGLERPALEVVAVAVPPIQTGESPAVTVNGIAKVAVSWPPAKEAVFTTGAGTVPKTAEMPVAVKVMVLPPTAAVGVTVLPLESEASQPETVVDAITVVPSP